MPHVNINIYLSSITDYFFDKPTSFCETEWRNWRSNKINAELLWEQLALLYITSYKEIPGRNPTSSSRAFLDSYNSWASNGSSTRGWFRGSLHLATSNPPVKETPPGPAWIGHVRSDNIVEIKSFLTRYHCVETTLIICFVSVLTAYWLKALRPSLSEIN